MARLPATISPIRCAGTPISLARRYCESPIGRRNSSSRSSPGVTGLSLTMASRSFSGSPRPRHLRRRRPSSGSIPGTGRSLTLNGKGFPLRGRGLPLRSHGLPLNGRAFPLNGHAVLAHGFELCHGSADELDRANTSCCNGVEFVVVARHERTVLTESERQGETVRQRDLAKRRLQSAHRFPEGSGDLRFDVEAAFRQ